MLLEVRNVNFPRIMRFSFDNLTHVVLWTKGQLIYKNPFKDLSPQIAISESTNLAEENWFFHDSPKNHIKSTTEQRII